MGSTIDASKYATGCPANDSPKRTRVTGHARIVGAGLTRTTFSAITIAGTTCNGSNVDTKSPCAGPSLCRSAIKSRKVRKERLYGRPEKRSWKIHLDRDGRR